MKPLSILFLFMLTSLASYSQVTISNVSYTTADVPVKSTEDPMKDSAFTSIVFNISNLKASDQVAFKAGTAQGKEDILSLNMIALEKDGKSYLAQGSDWFPIESNKVTIRRVIPKLDAIKSTYTTVEAKDKNGKKYDNPGAEVKQQVK